MQGWYEGCPLAAEGEVANFSLSKKLIWLSLLLASV